MSEYDLTTDESDAVCPYCGHRNRSESEDYSETERTETCDECGKKYRLWQTFSVENNAAPDCELNKTQHKWQTLTTIKDWQFCTICGKTRRKP
jgi:uncharacterized Zn-finger protein